MGRGVVSDILRRIVERNREPLDERKRLTPLASQRRRAEGASPPRAYRDALARPGLSVVAEIKRASPAKGLLRPDLDVAGLARAFEANGAACLSVITEEHFFQGSLDHLAVARECVGLPVLRKDFLWDPYQVIEARAKGADAVLLIVAILERTLLRDLIELASELGMAATVEVHDERELDSALAAGAALVGINNRDLRDFTVDLGTTERLVRHLPPGVVSVGESGIRDGRDVRRLIDCGANAVHVGETLMVAAEPGAALRGLIEEAERLALA